MIRLAYLSTVIPVLIWIFKRLVNLSAIVMRSRTWLLTLIARYVAEMKIRARV